MHPPFFVVDHKIDPARDAQSAHVLDDRRLLRRNRPERLDLAIVPALPPVAPRATAPGTAAESGPRRGLFARFFGAIGRRRALAPLLDKT